MPKLDVITVARKIQEKVQELETGRETPLKTAAQEKATTKANYSKAIAIAIMKLRAGKPAELDGETIKDPPATVLEKIAKGICWKEETAMELADAEYKRVIEKLECIRAETNAYQSINRFLDSTPNGG